MKRTLLLNAALSRVIASLGHGDMLVIGDAGLPIPLGPERIDLAVSRGIPSFADVLSAVMSEMQVERALIAEEACLDKPNLPRWCEPLAPVVPQTVPHAELKRLCLGAAAVVRTGECTPYHNVVLVAGVVF